MKSELDSLKDVFTDLSLLLIKFAKSPHEEIADLALKNLREYISRQGQREKNPEDASNPQNPSASVVDNRMFSGLSDSKTLSYDIINI